MDQLSSPSHPYYPTTIDIVGYVANQVSSTSLLLGAGILCGVIGIVVCKAAKWQNRNLLSSEIGVVLWFVISGSSHLFFEGYFVLHHGKLAGMQTFAAQFWKEYSLSDSRYLTSDRFVVPIEAVTVCTLGPLCFLAAGLTVISHPMCHPVRLLVSALHIYSATLYFATSVFAHFMDGASFSRPEPLYFWGYFVLLNTIWIVIPSCLVWRSLHKIKEAFRKSETCQCKTKSA